MSQTDPEDNSSDNYDIQYLHHPAGIVEQVTVDNVTGDPKKDQSPTAATATTAERLSDAASIQSSSPLGPINDEPPETVSSSLSPPSPTRSAHTVATEDRTSSVGRRSTPDPRSSRRLSGFFNNLIHRRDGQARTGTAIREEQPPAASPSSKLDKSGTNDNTRSSSPLPTNVVPPPRLPPPTLQELGLSFSVLTADLSPSHFSTPPSSGAFLSPHYLLLCHAQGLDVLPLVSPPEPQPYALIRRVSFKSIVVMEQRGVLVAIAGRRDGVRVYALEEIRKAVEWRIDVEVRRERDRMRREMAKKVAAGVVLDGRNSAEKPRKASLSTPPPGESSKRPPGIVRKGSHGHITHASQTPPAPLIPRTPTIRKANRSSSATPTPSVPPPIPQPSGRPPPYSPSDYTTIPPDPRPHNPIISVEPTRSRSRGGSVSDVLSVPPLSRLTSEVARPRDTDEKDWVESSDDEAINIVAAGSSGSQALDERTSATASRHQTNFSQSTAASTHSASQSQSHIHPNSPVIARRNRPANLDLSLSRSNAGIPPPEPSPAPTLLTLRQALAHPPITLRDDRTPEPDTPRGDLDPDDDDDEGGSNSISLSQALLESRLPDLPPPGTRQPQAPILISSHPVASPDDEPSSPRNSTSQQSDHETPTSSRNRRRRWSLMLTGSSASTDRQSTSPAPQRSAAPTLSREQTPTGPNRTAIGRSRSQTRTPRRPSSANTAIVPVSASTLVPPPLPDDAASVVASTSALSVASATSATSSRSRFIPRIISNAFQSIKSDSERPSTSNGADSDSKKNNGAPMLAHTPPPKLEYVKLPGTKGSLMIKAVETAKKSFLAILCGENGEKVELFAGTYRTALGLSRTFILPDSPRSLELQLQGDDLVEVFLVFSQNVFGLEPATVRVREVRIGRAERRAARRRARELRSGDPAVPNNDSEGALAGNGEEENTNVNVSIGVSVSVGSTVVASGTGPQGPQTPQFVANEHPQERSVPPTPGPASAAFDVSNEGAEGTATPAENGASANNSAAEELIALATARMGPYTTFQQLTFAPQFPLASIADEYVIPPTYPDFIGYREEYEPGDSVDLSQINFSPPGLPVPTPSAPSKWFYRDPKGNVHGPWKPSLMQAWYKDGLLPPDLPVRKEEDTEYILLKDLRAQSVDPTHPFKPPPAPTSGTSGSNIFQPSDKPLLKPISLLTQPKHFGPPALFFSSRGGHSTTIVDARGRSVLKGRFLWSEDERSEDDIKSASLMGRLGDVKRLEAVDIKDRSVLIAMRQGGVEAVDIGDALLKPADESRTALPQFSPSLSNMNRREPFVWRIGTPVAASTNSAAAATILSRPKGSHIPKPKLSAGLAKSPGARTEFNVGDSEPEFLDEVLFLGRKNDEIYICERNAGSFRILRLCPSS